MPGHTAAKRRKTAKKVSRKIKKLKGEGKSQKQSVAIALDTVRRKDKKKRKGSTFE